MRLTALAICLLAVAAAGAQAQSHGVYKWKDANGVSHYSDKPPASGKFGNVEANASARITAPKPPEPVDPRCAQARQNLQTLQSDAADIGLDRDGDGKPDAPMSAEQRTRQITMVEASIAAYCPSTSP